MFTNLYNQGWALKAHSVNKVLCDQSQCTKFDENAVPIKADVYWVKKKSCMIKVYAHIA